MSRVDDLVGLERDAAIPEHSGGVPEPRADQGESVLCGPDAAERGDELGFGVHPVRLGVDQGAVHVPENGGRHQFGHDQQSSWGRRRVC